MGIIHGHACFSSECCVAPARSRRPSACLRTSEIRGSLAREVEEEIGLPPESYEILESRGGYRYFYPEGVKERKKGNFDGQEQTYFLCQLGADAPSIDLESQTREFRDYKWIGPQEFSVAWLPEFKREVYRRVMRDFFSVEI